MLIAEGRLKRAEEGGNTLHPLNASPTAPAGLPHLRATMAHHLRIAATSSVARAYRAQELGFSLWAERRLAVLR
jgi:hypothetical protein